MAPSALPAAVLFDMDGTLVDTEGHWLDAEVHVMGLLGASWHPEDQVACLGGPLEKVTAHMRIRSGSSLSDHEVGLLLMDAMESRLRSTPPAWQPGARDLLTECRGMGIPTALVSASWARLIRAVADRMEEELTTLPFDVIVAGDDVTYSKPHPEPYVEAARLLGVRPDECLAIEDSPTGVTSARDAGCRVVAVPHIADVAHLGTAVVTSLAGATITSLWHTARLSD
jgi:HAD superfamily hydrolase (TIGR01509 family)